MVHYINNDSLIELDNFIKKNIKVDKIITSPPYNIFRKTSKQQYDKYVDGILSNNEYINWILQYFNKFDKILNKNGCILWNMSYGTDKPDKATLIHLLIAEIINKTNFITADVIVWKKKNTTPNNVSKNKLTRICEFIYVFSRKDEFKTFETNKKIKGKRKTGQLIYQPVYNFIEAKNNDGKNPYNKAVFSTELILKLFDIYVKPDDVVLDPFAGIGTVGKAAKIRNNECFLIELSKKQVEYGTKKIEELKY